jgi:opacity protein-like surface antigen
MKLKRKLLATSAFALLAGASQAHAGGLYLSVFGGANFLNDQSGRITDTTTASWSSDAETGFVIGGALGTRLDNWAKGLRVEVEASYRRNDVGGRWTTDDGSTGGFIDANASTFALMANAWYDIDIGSKVRPYVGGGVGWSRSQLDAGFVETFTDTTPVTPNLVGTTTAENSGFAWHLGFGINYEVAQDVDLGIGYRYFRGTNLHDAFFDGKNVDTKFQNENHGVQVNLTIGIN